MSQPTRHNHSESEISNGSFALYLPSKLPMKSLTLFTLLLTISLARAQSPTVRDYTTKNAKNAAERTAILDAFRDDLKKEWKIDFIFVVKYLKVSGNYACLLGSAERKDGKPMEFPDDSYDCCHAEALLKKVNGRWTVLAGSAFSTDVWWDGINKQYPEVSVAVYPDGAGWVR